MAAPWFKVYSQEFLSDPKVKMLDHDQIGKLVLLWAFANEDGCCIPSDPKAIGKLLGIQNQKQMDNHLVWIKQFFVPVDGDETKLQSVRLRKEQRAYQEKCDKLKANGSLGGRPKKPNGYPDGLANGNQMGPEEGSKKKEKEYTPLTPQGGTGDAATLLPMDPAPKAKRQRKGKYQSEDIAPENAEYLQKVYERIPAEHPTTGEPVHKGPYATAARAFQAIIDAGEASARELMAVGTLYYRAESLGQEWADWANRVWDTRPTAMMHVATLYGPEKRPYRQLLPVARELIAKKEQRLASQNAEMGMAS